MSLAKHPGAAPPHLHGQEIIELRRANARLGAENVAMRMALRRFGNDDNWRRKELTNGPDEVTWALGFDPAAFARATINEKKAGDR